MEKLTLRLMGVLAVFVLLVSNDGGECARTQLKPPANNATAAASQPGAKSQVSSAHALITPRHRSAVDSRSTVGRHGALLVDRLTDNFQCPTAAGSLLFTSESPLRNCSQSAFQQWALSCLSENGPNQLAAIILRTAKLGQKCRHVVTCQWPSCPNYDLSPTSGDDTQIIELFEENVLGNVMVVINTSHNAICEKFTDATEILQEIKNRNVSIQNGLIISEMAAVLAQRIIEGECLRASSAAAVKVQLSAASQQEIDPLYNAYLNHLMNKYSKNNESIDEAGVRQLLIDVSLSIESDEDAHNGTESTVNGSQRRKHRAADAEINAPWAAAVRAHLRTIRSADIPTANLNLSQCLESAALMEIFDVDKSAGLDRAEFLQFLTYIVYQISNGNKCDPVEEVTSDSNRAEVYGFGTLAVFIISACSALGFLVIPMLSESVYEIMMTAFIALAFGTLSGDALLHMLPECLIPTGSDESVETEAFYKTMVITFSIYILFVFEGFTHMLVAHTHDKDESGEQHGHSHTHDHQYVQKQMLKQNEAQMNAKNGVTELVSVPSTDILIMEELEKHEQESKTDEEEIKNLQELILSTDRTPVCLGLTSLALVIIIGDAIHNVTDGISIGASFASDLSTGLSTSLAVFFHELPHEFGDFVILLTTGLSLKRALAWNFISSLSAFLGLYIGIAVGENEEANKWIFAVTSGMFLYVAIADMLPEMRNIKSKRPGWAFFAQNVGALFGIGFMIFMHYLEDLIHF